MRAVLAVLIFTVGVHDARAENPAKETTIDLSFDTTDIRVRPNPMVSPAHGHHVFRVVLSNHNEVIESNTSTANSDGLTKNDSRQGNLGSEMTSGNVGWHVSDNNSLVRIEDHPQNILAMKIILLPHNLCRLMAVAKLKPGYTEYAFYSLHEHTVAYYSRWDISNRTCAIR